MSKKLFIPVMALLISLGCPSLANAQLSKSQEKKIQKEVKQRMKELNKEGWKTVGSHTLESALTKHLEKLEKEGTVEFYGIGRSSIKSRAKSNAESTARQSYAAACGTKVQGKIVSEGKSEERDGVFDDYQKQLDGYVQNIEKAIARELTPSYTIVREFKDAEGKPAFEFQCFFILDEETASKIRIQALEMSAKESEAAQRWAREVEKWVLEPVTVED